MIDGEDEGVEEPADETDASPAEASRHPRFYCGGAKRVDPYTEKKVCDYRAYQRWFGPCPKCSLWYGCLPYRKSKNAKRQVTLADAANAKPLTYYPTGIEGLDHVLGGGFVLERTLFLGGPQGLGKTSMLLQAADGFAQHGRKAYFASAEMTQKAILDYAHRLQVTNPNVILFADPEGIEVRDLFDAVMESGAKLIIGDSLQVFRVDDCEGDVGEPTMMNAVVNMTSSFCQEKHVAAVLISHLNKQGELAGARKAAYLSDGILRLEPRVEYDEAGEVVRGTGGLRQICWDGKSRQSRVDLNALVEMDAETGRTGKLSPEAVRAMSKLMR